MTLRCTIEIVRFGDEDDKHVLFEFDISNEGIVHRGMFGHDLAAYWVKVFDYHKSFNAVTSKFSEPKRRLVDQFPLMELHDRRDGAEILVRKVLQQWEDKPHDDFQRT